MTNNILSQQIRQILSCTLCPDKEFLISKYTYTDIYALAAGIRESLSSDTENNTVCVCTEDKGIIAASFLASLSCKSTFVLPYSYSKQAIQEACNETGFTKAIVDLPENLPSGTEVIKVRPAPDSDNSLNVPGDPDEVVIKLFTGGSTGRPKLWSKTPRILLTEADCLRKKLNVSGSDQIAATVPPYHIYGLFLSVIVPFISCASVIADICTYPQEMLTAIENATILVSVPIHYRALNRSKIRKHSLRIATSSAALLDKDASEYFSKQTGAGIVEVYGSTETGAIATRCCAEGESSFYPFDIVDWKIENELLYVRSKLISPELQRDPDGFFITGDRAACYGNKSFGLLGRADGIVKVAGKRVDLNEIQEKLKQAPEVRDALVISLPGTKGRDNEIAVLAEGNIDPSQLRLFASELLEPYAVPRYIRIVANIPVTSTGKYDRKLIEQIFYS